MWPDRPSAPVRLEKVKRPGGIFWYDLAEVREDEHGHWLAGDTASAWGAPHDGGVLPCPVIVLVDRRLEIDVCRRPEPHGSTWRYVDLELDVVWHDDRQLLEIEDEDEYDEACAAGHMDVADAMLARDATALAAIELGAYRAPWIHQGWDLLRGVAESGDAGPAS